MHGDLRGYNRGRLSCVTGVPWRAALHMGAGMRVRAGRRGALHSVEMQQRGLEANTLTHPHGTVPGSAFMQFTIVANK